MNYSDLFRVTLPETMLEVAALIVLIVDLGVLRKAALKVRVMVAALLGVAGCGAALWNLQTAAVVQSKLWGPGYIFEVEMLLGQGSYITAAQCGILVLTALTLLLLIDSDFTKHVGEFVAVVLMAATGGLLVAAAQDLLVIFVGLELLSLGLYILTAFAKSSGKSAEAAMKYYLFGGMSAAFLLFGFSYFYGLTGSTNLSAIQLAIAESGPSPLFYVAWILVVAGLGFKIAAVPFHQWAPDTYEGAPAPAAAFIASVSKVASFTLLITLTEIWFGVGDKLTAGAIRIWQPLTMVMLVLSVASMVVGNLAALAQISVRRLLAYSAIAHVGYMLLGLAAQPKYIGFDVGWVPLDVNAQLKYVGTGSLSNFIESVAPHIRVSLYAVLYYVLTYGLTTIGAFGVVAVVERATGSDRLESFLGLHKRNPLLAAVLLVFFLSLAGIPPLVGFWAKFNLFAAVLGVSAGPVPFALVALAVMMSAVSLYYYLQVLKRAYIMTAIDETPIKAHPITMAVLVAIAAAVVVMGCFPSLLQGWIASFYPVL
jgi:NADH-quinone oxidoreductase subunit N